MSAAPVNITLLLIGNSHVGKSSLLRRFSDEQWNPAIGLNATVGVEYRVHTMDVNGKEVQLRVWDTSGMERFRTITPSYYRGAQGIIVVYDVANRESFDALPKWFTDLDTYAPSTVVKIVVGNKVDKEYSRQVPAQEGQAFATRMDALFIEASATGETAVGVQEAFRNIVERIIDTRGLQQSSAPRSSGTEGVGASAGAGALVRHRSIHLQQVPENAGGGGCGC
ncbi:hypothetical protein V8D89_006253 [Ganoderma adspersum]